MVDRLKTLDSTGCTRFLRTVFLPLLALTGGLFSGRNAFPADDLGVIVPEGFEVTRFADDDLAHDIFSMTVDSLGRVVVSGPGYVRILHDRDGDGRAEDSTLFVDGPSSGAQGLYFYGRDLLCTGDSALLRYKDRNGDDRADGPPEVFLKIKAGGEHDAHAIRKGPDGWWYLIAGNMAGVNSSYINLPGSPVQNPNAGTILRFKPDLSSGEVFADGYRNAYDFDFGPTGEMFVFDSDGEREVSLPWYLPTRVFASTTGSDHGWFSRSWKRPDYFLDMPPVLAEFGRGSPSGVVTYRHTQFPPEYHGAAFVLDWTYGRVWALPLERQGSTWTTKPIEFMKATGQHGFAPTDAEVGPDGSLYLCVGGRGTRGGVYRIRAKDSPAQDWAPAATSPAEKLNACLDAPQPLSSWSRKVWEPLALELRSEAFIKAAQDSSRSEAQRLRAIEILTEKFQGLDADLQETLSSSESPRIRERTAWSLGRSRPINPNTVYIARALGDGDPLVVRAALESLLSAEETVLTELAAPIGRQLAHDDRFVRLAAIRVMARTSPETFRTVSAVAINAGWQGAAGVAAAFALKKPGYSAYPIDIGTRILKASHPLPLKLEATRLIQLGLGDLAPTDDSFDETYDGYRSKVDLTKHDRELDPLRATLASLYPTGTKPLDTELERIIAMVQPANGELLQKVLSQITPESHPVDDIHRLIVASRMPVQRTPEQRSIIAAGLVDLETKISRLGLQQDSSWADRVLGMYSLLCAQDPQLPLAVLKHPGFGLPGHVTFVSEFPPEALEPAIAAFVQKMDADPDYQWNSDVVFLMGASPNPAHRQLIRSKMNDFALRNAVLMSLAESPSEADRPLFVSGLETAPIESLLECLRSLALLSPSQDPVENVALLQTLRRLSNVDQELQARDQAEEILRRNLGQSFGYVLAQPGNPQAAAIEQWTRFIQSKFPEEFARQSGAAAEDQETLDQLLSQVDWTQGDLARGKALFQSRGCVQCHGSRTALGPDLAGVTGRFSQKDLFTAIMFPHRDVSPRYQTTQIATRDGLVRSGLIVYEAVDGVVLRDSNNQTYRIETTDIEDRRTTTQSLMPSGLMKGFTPQDVADLYRYLQQGPGPTSSPPQTAERHLLE